MVATPRFLIVLCLFAAGCASKLTPELGPKADPRSPNPTAPQSPPASEPAALEFLQSLEADKVNFDAVSPVFLRLIAEPGVLPSDIQRGYDKYEAKAWFDAFTKKKYSPPLFKSESGDFAVYTGVMTDTHGGYVLRMVKQGNGWKVDWLQRTPSPVTLPDSADAVAVVEGMCLLHSLPPRDDREFRFVASMLTPELQRKLGPPSFDSDRERGYNARDLRTALNRFALVDTFELLRADGTVMLSGAMPEPKQPGKLSLLLKESPRPGQWLVDEIRVK